MKPSAYGILILGFMLAPFVMATDPKGDPAENLGLIRKYIAPLTHPLGGRLPVLVWQTPDTPTGLELGDIEGVWDTYMERGIMPLCNPVSSVEAAREYLPIFKYISSKGYPIVFLAQGWVQRVFMRRRADGGRDLYCPHEPPARADHHWLACPSYMMETPRLRKQAEAAEAVCRVLKDAGLEVRMIMIDYESAAYLRNRADEEEHVREAMTEAMKCPRCLKRFGRERLSTPDGYRRVVDEARAYTIRVGLTEPCRKVFPNILLGNFFAWPVDREQPRRPGFYSAYGWPGSGMNVAQPRCYIPAGWGGAGKSREKINWNAFYYCMSSFSRAKRVLHDGEMMIPWLSILQQGRYQPRIQKGSPLPSRETMREVVRHTMLRGAETFAVFIGRFRGVYPPDFKYPLLAEASQWVYNVMDVQAAFNEMLEFNDFLRKGKVLNLDVTGEYSRLDETTATWSGVATDEKALVRTVSFGPSVRKSIRVFGKEVELPFDRRGRFFWITPDGTATAVDVGPEPRR